MTIQQFPGERTSGDPAALVTIIERRRGWALLGIGELWRHRELLYFLAWRDFQVRYKQTVLGILWALLQPLSFVAAFTLFMSRLADGVEGPSGYPVFVLSGLIPWNFFSGTVSSASQSIVGNQALISKIYFPRLVIPASAAGAPMADLTVCLLVLAPLLAVAGVRPGVRLFLLPIVLLGLLGVAIGVGACLAALSVSYRDFRYVVPWLLQLGLFLTPSVYLPDARPVPVWARTVLPLNPVQGLVTGFRAGLGEGPVDLPGVLSACGLGLGVFLLGCLYFRQVERSFADVV